MWCMSGWGKKGPNILYNTAAISHRSVLHMLSHSVKKSDLYVCSAVGFSIVMATTLKYFGLKLILIPIN